MCARGGVTDLTLARDARLVAAMAIDAAVESSAAFRRKQEAGGLGGTCWSSRLEETLWIVEEVRSGL